VVVCLLLESDCHMLCRLRSVLSAKSVQKCLLCKRGERTKLIPITFPYSTHTAFETDATSVNRRKKIDGFQLTEIILFIVSRCLVIWIISI
jgi:hypothetical protein